MLNVLFADFIVKRLGGVAQLGERLHGMQEAIGSIPFTSTNFIRGVAQPGSASALGAGGRRFKSCRPDHFFLGV